MMPNSTTTVSCSKTIKMERLGLGDAYDALVALSQTITVDSDKMMQFKLRKKIRGLSYRINKSRRFNTTRLSLSIAPTDPFAIFFVHFRSSMRRPVGPP